MAKHFVEMDEIERIEVDAGLWEPKFGWEIDAPPDPLGSPIVAKFWPTKPTFDGWESLT